MTADRLESAQQTGLSPSTLVGSHFHSDAARGWQGAVVAEPSPGIYLVETYSWLTGDSYNQTLVSIQDMLATGWQFYDDNEWMQRAYTDTVSLQWERARETQTP